jgi:hypothetical protein
MAKLGPENPDLLTPSLDIATTARCLPLSPGHALVWQGWLMVIYTVQHHIVSHWLPGEPSFPLSGMSVQTGWDWGRRMLVSRGSHHIPEWMWVALLPVTTDLMVSFLWWWEAKAGGDSDLPVPCHMESEESHSSASDHQVCTSVAEPGSIFQRNKEGSPCDSFIWWFEMSLTSAKAN